MDINSHSFACSNCGAPMKYKPGTVSMVCDHCHSMNEIPQEETVIEELDFEQYAQAYEASNTVQQKTITCNNCKATISVDEHLKSLTCLYCGSPLIETDIKDERLIKPNYVLPFNIDQQQINDLLANWIKGLWFAPNNLKKAACAAINLNGLYLPYWTYDAQTDTQYAGMRGTAYYVTTGSGDKKRTERRIRWTSVSGSVHLDFDDVMVSASFSIPTKALGKLENWDTQNLVHVDDRYLSGFTTERYQVDLKNGFVSAKKIMEQVIERGVRRDIGGDEQRILNSSTKMEHITFKHILLPLYISTYRYGNRIFHFYVNGRTGQLTGERPYSAIKITLTVIVVLIVIAALYFASKR